MINLQPILKYQEVDGQLRSILKLIDSHEDSIKLKKIKSNIGKAGFIVQEERVNAEKLIKSYEKTVAEYENTFKKIEFLSKKLGSFGDDAEKERKETVAELESLKEVLIGLEKRANGYRDLSTAILKKHNDAGKIGKNFMTQRQEAISKVEDVKSEYKAQIEEKKQQLQLLAKDVAPDIMERYKKLTSENKANAIVAVKILDGGKSYGCNGCGMTMNPEAKSSLDDESKGYCICDTCRRIVYKAGK